MEHNYHSTAHPYASRNASRSHFGASHESHHDGEEHVAGEFRGATDNINDQFRATDDAKQSIYDARGREANYAMNPPGASLDEVVDLRGENAQMLLTIQGLKRELSDQRMFQKKLNATDESKIKDLQMELMSTKDELRHAKEGLVTLHTDRKRMKSEKLELLSEMKQLYSTLEEKDTELRDFIRQYETRMKESDDHIQQLLEEKESIEAEKWELVKMAREANEKCAELIKQKQAQDEQIKNMQIQIDQHQQELSVFNSHPGYRQSLASSASSIQPSFVNSQGQAMDSLSVDTNHLGVKLRRHSPSPIGYRNTSSDFMSYNSASSLPFDEGTSDPPGGIGASRSNDDLIDTDRKSRRRTLGGGISRMFSRKTGRKSTMHSEPNMLKVGSVNRKSNVSMLTRENYQEKLSLLAEAKTLPIGQWRANQVLAWMEIELSMPMYGSECSANIKSGKVLLSLSDSELENTLGIHKPLHRKKLRLAIDEKKDPSFITYPLGGSMDHTWVAQILLPHFGLSQYSAIFEENLVDGRMLQFISRKDYEKHLGVHSKFHQTSLLHGIEMLRRVNFDKQALKQRCESPGSVSDIIVWSNVRLEKWIESIDLDEYTSTMSISGIHGAVLMLESGFTADTLANHLHIPSSKQAVRRHLAAEMDILLSPTMTSETYAAQQPFIRSYLGGTSPNNDNSRNHGNKKITFRGSLGRALGRKVRQQMSPQDNIDGRSPYRLADESAMSPLNSTKRSLSMELLNQPASMV